MYTQVELTANFATKELTIKQLGVHPSRVASKELTKNESSILGQMGKFELVPDKYKYHIHFAQRVPKSVMMEIKQGADEQASDSGDSDEDDVLSSNHLTSGKKRKRDLDNQDHLQEVTPPKKKSKLDKPKAALQGSDACAAKPQQTSLTAFYKPKSTNSEDIDTSTSAKPMVPQWDEKGSMLILRFGQPISSNKTASYDLDGTLIETASGRKFATSSSDWKLLPKVANKLLSLHKEGYKIVIISNQLGISRGKPTVGDFKQKAEAISHTLKVPLLLLAATSKDMYRKPCMAMWEHLTRSENGEFDVDIKESFYVGDAAGREANWKPGQWCVYLSVGVGGGGGGGGGVVGVCGHPLLYCTALLN